MVSCPIFQDADAGQSSVAGLPRSSWFAATMSFCDYVSILPCYAKIVKGRLKKEAGLAREDTISKIKKKTCKKSALFCPTIDAVGQFCEIIGIFLLFYEKK